VRIRLRVAPFTFALVSLAWLPTLSVAQGRQGGGTTPAAIPSIADKTAGMQRLDGYFPLYWDDKAGHLWMEIPRLDTEVLWVSGLAAGLGSNDIGLDRGQVQDERIVTFHRVGPKVLLEQPNYTFRASSTNPAEIRAVADAFAKSNLWGFTVGAESGGHVLVDLNDFLIRDVTNMGPRMRPGTYRLDAGRSAIAMPTTENFPKNTEIEVELTFVRQPGAAGGGRFGGGFFEGVGDVAAAAEAATLRAHHSFVELPGPGYVPRAYDPRSSFFPFSYVDYSTPLSDQMAMTKRFITRHRLKKKDPSAKLSDPVKPIVYYVDPGTPEPIRSALLEGARWWNQAFEAAGYRNAFQVVVRPDSINPLDIRYNVINWAHRSTRGWSYGGSVTDPRTGEIIKGVVTLGSMRVRQDYLIAEGLLAPYKTGDETPPELAQWALARVRQLAAHEVGHTLGFAHNYYDSRLGRISVMDYPAPLVTLKQDGTLDYSSVYDVGIGAWDKVAITWGYQDFPAGTNEHQALQKILDDAWGKDLIFLTNQDMSASPKVDQWSNGVDPVAQLNVEMDVRRAALNRFGENAIRRGMPIAEMEEALVPLYLHHRYQVEASATALGGQDFIYALRGDGRTPTTPISGPEQRAVLGALNRTLRPSELVLPQSVVKALPPRPQGYGTHRELFPRYTGLTFDAITPAVAAAVVTVDAVLDAQRAARLVEQHALDPSLPGLSEVIDSLFASTFGAPPANPYEAEVSRAEQRVVTEHLMQLAARAPMPQVRAVASLELERKASDLAGMIAGADEANAAAYTLLARDIRRFIERPYAADSAPSSPDAPPGAPIGQPALEFIHRYLEPWCAWADRRIGG
jgi:Met-zincin/Domain of unknown function (DUF5117)